MTKRIRASVILLLLMMMPVIAFPYGDPDDSDSWDEDPEGVPIDGGVSLLLAAGAGYGVKKLRDYRNANK